MKHCLILFLLFFIGCKSQSNKKNDIKNIFVDMINNRLNNRTPLVINNDTILFQAYLKIENNFIGKINFDTINNAIYPVVNGFVFTEVPIIKIFNNDDFLFKHKHFDDQANKIRNFFKEDVLIDIYEQNDEISDYRSLWFKMRDSIFDYVVLTPPFFSSKNNRVFICASIFTEKYFIQEVFVYENMKDGGWKFSMANGILIEFFTEVLNEDETKIGSIFKAQFVIEPE